MNTQTFDTNLAKLNPEQLRAIETLEGAVMVIAGPGTGKTQIIGMRTANIILKSGVEAGNILITTFTEAWVIAIRERLISMIGSEAYKVQVSTIHSFAQDVIKNFPEKFTQEKMNTAIDDLDMLEILSEILRSKLEEHALEYLTSYGDPLFYLREIKSQISKLKGEWVSPERFEKLLEEEECKSLEWLEEKRNNKRIKKIEKYEQEHETHVGKLRELLSIYREYTLALRSRHLYDFNDMINFVLEKFRTDSAMRAYFAESYQYIMLDEYQDTNNPQNEIINLILSESDTPNIMVVGDDDQSIYRFQGANIENMLDFTTQYPWATLIVLDKNYRSQQAILDAASECISENSERLINRIPGLSKDIISQRDFEILPPRLYPALTRQHEDLFITREILRLQSQGTQYDDIAIIVRSNAEVSYYSSLLSDSDIPVYSKFESNILDSDIIRHIIALLGILENPFEHEQEFLDLLRCSFVSIPNQDILKISNYLYRENYVRRGNKLKIFEVLQDSVRLDVIGVSDASLIENFVSLILDLQQDFAQENIIYGFSQMLRKFSLLESDASGVSFDDIQDISTLFTVLQDWQRFNKSLSLGSILAKLELYRKYNLRIERIISLKSQKGVQIVTAHSSKGLEYDHVFIPGLFTGSWDNKVTRKLISLPEWIAWNGLQSAQLDAMSDAEKKQYYSDRQMQEDRRLFFVALTRAKYSLSLSYPQSIDGKVKIISPFVSELSTLQEIDYPLSESDISQRLVSQILSESKFIDYGQQELDYIAGFFENYRLSASDLNTFLEDPKNFLYRTLLRYPFEANENSLFGTMYHRTLELFYKQIQDTGKIQDLSYMHFVFERQVQNEFLTDEQRVRLLKRWFEALEGYYRKYEGTFTAPLKTEYRFSRRNIFFEEVPLTGVIDKIELMSDDFSQNFSGWSLFSQVVRITDYKTASAKYIGEIKWINKDGIPDEWYERGKYGRQLMFYKLLFENDSELSSQFQIWALELDFCEGKNGKYLRQEVEFSQEEYEDFKQLVRESYARMTSIEFWREFLKK